MRKIQVFHVDAFTDQAFGGNAAGIVPDAEGLTDIEMQNIARELSLSETAFVMPTQNDAADVKVRYFTPSSEIDFCGHATIGLSWVMATEFNWVDKAEVIRLETNIGVVPVKWSLADEVLQSVVMTQVSPKVKSVDYALDEICRLVGVSEGDLDRNYPVKLAYTGNWHLLIPVKSRMAVDLATPIFEELAQFNKEHNVSTTHLFTFDSSTDAKIYTRDFAPAVGITEDPVTGSANGALAGYLVLEEILDSKEAHHFKIHQGHAMGRPGTLDITITPDSNGKPIVSVGGKAVPTISGILTF
jgi:trans-2,3-dihydro-3-hydroxyanthranilate isomerase